MIFYTHSKNRSKTFSVWRVISSLIITLFACPMEFIRKDISAGIDNSWIIALNTAIQRGAIFGKDFVFTYGPLGFLSTRNADYVGNAPIIAGDAFLLAGIFLLAYRFFSTNIIWLILLFSAALAMRTSNYSQTLFLLYIIYTSLIVTDKKSDSLYIMYAAIGVPLLFFIKINYGFIAVPTFFVVCSLLASRSVKSALIYGVSCIIPFFAIGLSVGINYKGYFRYGLELIRGYDEAMMHTVNTQELPIWFAAIFICTLCTYLGIFMYKALKLKSGLLTTNITVSLAAIACYLFFRNAFTRYDDIHYRQFFCIFPFFFAVFAHIIQVDKKIATKIVSMVIALVSLSVLDGNDGAREFSISGSKLNDRLSIAPYYAGICQPFSYGEFPEKLRDDSVKKVVGAGTCDLIAHEMSFIKVNELNYNPRPVPQAYSVYTPDLDSLNAIHFLKQNRPEFILVDNDGVDDRYAIWDETLTKATIHLNYEYTELKGEEHHPFMLFKTKSGIGEWPIFKKISELVVRAGDTINVPQSVSTPVYMSAKIEYTGYAKIKKLIFPMHLGVTLLTDSQVSHFTLVRSIVAEPVLISHFVQSNTELNNFLCGNLQQNKRIRSFVVGGESAEHCKSIVVSFYYFDNYRSQKNDEAKKLSIL
jgi:hypothetical protein